MPAELTLRQLRYFVALSEAGQYRRAARRLGISQPSLSLQIGLLEEHLAMRLVERRRSGLVLTPQGRAVLTHARRVLDAVEDLQGQSDPLRAGLSGTLRLGSTPTIGPYLLPRVLRQLHAAYPDLRLVVRDGAPRDLVEDLSAGVHDVILTQLPVAPDDLHVRPLFHEPLFVAVARGHALAGRGTIAEADLAGQDVLGLSPAYALHAQTAALCRDVGARLREEFEGTSLDALRQMVAMDMGLTLLPALYIRSEAAGPDGDVAVLRLKGNYRRTIGLAWRKSTGKPRAFVQFAEAIDAVLRAEFADAIHPAT